MAADYRRGNTDKPLERKWMQEKLRDCGYYSPMWEVSSHVFYQVPPAEAFNKLMAHEASRQQILSPYREELGVGAFVEQSTGAYFVAFVLGKQKMERPPQTAPSSS
jgi:hypothetical protein